MKNIIEMIFLWFYLMKLVFGVDELINYKLYKLILFKYYKNVYWIWRKKSVFYLKKKNFFFVRSILYLSIFFIINNVFIIFYLK